MAKTNRKWWIAGGLAAFAAAAMLVGAAFLLFRFLPDAKTYSPLGKKIAVLEVRGSIAGMEKTIDILHQYRDDNTVAGVILYINSPGGAVAPTQELFDEILAVKKKNKKVYAYISDVGASGGYYLACSADKIYAAPGSLVGSIGVIMTFTNVEGLLGKVGLTTKTIKTGAYKDIGSPFRPMTPEEEALLGATLEDVYQQFVDVVTTGRFNAVAARLKRTGTAPPPRAEVRDYVLRYADGRIFSGRQAKALGFVDENGNFQTCVDDMARTLGIKGTPTLVRRRVKEPGLFDALTGKTKFKLFEGATPASQVEIKYAWY